MWASFPMMHDRRNVILSIGCFAVVAALPFVGCAVAKGDNPPAAAPVMPEGEATRLGAAAGVVNPRLADCGAHCEQELRLLARETHTQPGAAFTRSCVDACAGQTVPIKAPDRVRAHDEAARGRSLYLVQALIEQSVWCIKRLADQSAEAMSLVSARDAAERDPDAVRAAAAEQVVAGLVVEREGTAEARRIVAAREELERVIASGGGSSAVGDQARKRLANADEVANATPLGRRLQDAIAAAQVAREKANQSPAARESQRCYQEYTTALQARLAAASPTDRSRMSGDMATCLDAHLTMQMANAVRPNPGH